MSICRWLVRSGRAALLCALASCAGSRASAPPELFRDGAGRLVPTERLATQSFAIMQRIRGKQGNADVALQCFVQLSGGKLTLSGTTLHKMRAFEIEQVGSHISAESTPLRDVPFDPVYLLHDVHRIFFRGLGGARSDGVHERVDEHEVVRERWQDGQLVERSFHSVSTFARLIVITFEGAPAPLIAPRVRLTNLHYGYSLEIDNLRQEQLDQGYTLHVEKSAPASEP